MELTDLILITKTDENALLNVARKTYMEYKSALKFIQPRITVWKPKVREKKDDFFTNILS